MKLKDINNKRENLEKKIPKLFKIIYIFMEIKYNIWK